MAEALDGPLGGITHGFAGFKEPWTWEDNVASWYTFLDRLNNAQDRGALVAPLHPAQKTTLKLLLEWWYNDELPHSPALKEWLKTGEGCVPTRDGTFFGSEYEKSLFELWLWEIGTYEASKFQFQKLDLEMKIKVRRQHAAEVAAAYRISRACLQKSLASVPPLFTRHYNIDDTQASVSACVHACPWIKWGESGRGYPHYIWDIRQRCTIRYPSTNPDYLVISHTWGRWAIDNEKYDVAGVTWQIPANTIYDVRNVPEMLSNLPFQVEYVWLDLVCIPQDGTPLQQQEIARQAAIFESARYATIWLSDVLDLSGLRAAVDWLSMAYIRQFEKQDELSDEVAMSIEARADISSRLTRRPRNNIITPDTLLIPGYSTGDSEVREPHGWFTSLWTLQEACLRPDMFICDANWHLLTTGSGMSMRHVPLDHLIALFNLGWEGRNGKDPRQVPQSVKEIATIFSRTAMHKLLDMSGIEILILGNQRYCQDANRAKAIMSALGVTEWYKRNAATYDKATPAVRSSFIAGKYPLDFVVEVKEKFGNLIYAVSEFGSIDSVEYRYDSRKRLKETNLRGTMLPFGKHTLQQRFLLMNSLGVHEDITVWDWIIQRDGSVIIKKASIIASCPRGSKQELKGKVKSTLGGKNMQEECDILDWLSSFRPQSEKHAVYLFERASGDSFGIILERVYNSSFPKRPKRFIKIGTFWEPQTMASRPVQSLPQLRDVDWLVI